MTLLKHAEKQGNSFQNPVPTTVGGAGIIFKVLPLYLSNKAETEPKTPLGPFRTDPGVYAEPPASGLRVTWFGHSSFLLEIDGLRVLVDPVWDPRASPFSFMGPKRFFAPTLPLEALPELDAILISHDHYDHLGGATVKQLSQVDVAARARWITSLGVGRRLRGFGVPPNRIQELDWTDTTELPGASPTQALRVTAWPARHFSGRTALDRMSTLWSSFVIEGPTHRVYFGADSGPWPGFAEIMAQYPSFDLTLLEIGAYHPLWGQIHLGPDGAAEAYRQMGGPATAGALMPIHWGLFNLALHGWREPIERLSALADAEGWPLWLPTPGEPTEVVAGRPSQSAWWHAAARSEVGTRNVLTQQALDSQEPNAG